MPPVKKMAAFRCFIHTLPPVKNTAVGVRDIYYAKYYGDGRLVE